MKINDIEFTFGADPEFFVAKGGKPISAHGLIPGTKKEPFKVGYGAVQVDGMALEFNINPAKGEAGFIRNLEAVMGQILRMVPDVEYYDNPTAEFGFEYIDAQPMEAKELGCEPDFNAYTRDVNPRPDVNAPFRTAAGHIHIGWTNGVDRLHPEHFEACCTLTKMLDLYLGVPSLLWDEDDKRRKLYGAAGAFRPTHYGMEYRTLSNRWLRNDKPHLRKFVFNNTVKAIEKCFEDPEFADKPVFGERARGIVDGNKRDKAAQIVRYSKLFPAPITYKDAA
jgi:hypothetical protein